jgi:hypothetical protein
MANLKIISTGGGCEAYYLEHSLGRSIGGYFLITDIEGINVPNKGDKAILGWYINDGEFIKSIDIIY